MFNRNYGLLLTVVFGLAGPLYADDAAKTTTTEHSFKTHDGHALFGKLTLPTPGPAKTIVMYVQTAEGATVDMKRPKSATETFNYYDLYRQKLAAMNVGFFSYEGRGIRMGDKPPRYETIDLEVYNTSTLENKVRDALSAIALLRQQKGLEKTPLILMGASESTLLAAETAARAPHEVAGLVLYGILATNMRENFKYIMTDGAFLPYRQFFDTDNDGKITKAEFDADPKKIREKSRRMKDVTFETLDFNKDGVFSSADIVAQHTKKYVDAIDQDNFAVLQDWAKTSAAVAVPKDWFKDHFAHPPIWTFLQKLDIPVGCFHGGQDTMTPISGVKKLEEQAKQAGKTKMKFFYFDDLEHTLGIGSYFFTGKLPAGHEAIFAFIRDVTGK